MAVALSRDQEPSERCRAQGRDLPTGLRLLHHRHAGCREAYQLTPNNYIAHDLRYGQRTFSNYYTQEEKDAFLQYMEKLNEFEISEPDVLKDIFLGIYANPVERTKD